MKTIEQAAQEYWKEGKSSSDYKPIDIIKCFEAGIKFAQQWIDVNEELPLDKNSAIMVLVKIEGFSKKDEKFTIFSMGVYNHFFKNWAILHSLIENGFHAKSWKVTHWRPIE